MALEDAAAVQRQEIRQLRNETVAVERRCGELRALLARAQAGGDAMRSITRMAAFDPASGALTFSTVDTVTRMGPLHGPISPGPIGVPGSPAFVPAAALQRAAQAVLSPSQAAGRPHIASSYFSPSSGRGGGGPTAAPLLHGVLEEVVPQALPQGPPKRRKRTVMFDDTPEDAPVVAQKPGGATKHKQGAAAGGRGRGAGGALRKPAALPVQPRAQANDPWGRS